MARYIAFLRAVNVGKRKAPMAEVREALGELGLEGVATYIQSGNAFFDSTRRDRGVLRAEIEAGLGKRFGFAIPTMLRTVPELEKSLATDPFAGQPAVDDDVRHVVLYVDKPLPKRVKLPESSPREEFTLLAATKGEIFVLLRRVAGRTGNPAAYVEKQYGLVATARWFHTSQKIVDAAKK